MARLKFTKEHIDKLIKSHQRQKVKFVCSGCGASGEKNPSRMSSKYQFCNRDCWLKYNYIVKNNGQYKKGNHPSPKTEFKKGVKVWNLGKYGYRLKSKCNGRILDKQYGYIWLRVPDYYKTLHGYVLEHRYIMEQYLKRRLKKGEIVHHIDGDKTNNDIDNLEVMKRGNHQRLHMLMRYHG